MCLQLHYPVYKITRYPSHKSDKYPQTKFSPQDHVFYSLRDFLKFIDYIDGAPYYADPMVKLSKLNTEFEPIDPETLKTLMADFKGGSGREIRMKHPLVEHFCETITDLVHGKSCFGCVNNKASQKQHIGEGGCLRMIGWVDMHFEEVTDQMPWPNDLYRNIIKCECDRKLTDPSCLF